MFFVNSLREHNLERLDVEVMNRMKGLKSLDISDNEIGIIPAGLSLPNLTVLDCSDNNLFNLEFVKKFPRLHTLHVEGNNIEVSTPPSRYHLYGLTNPPLASIIWNVHLSAYIFRNPLIHIHKQKVIHFFGNSFIQAFACWLMIVHKSIILFS